MFPEWGAAQFAVTHERTAELVCNQLQPCHKCGDGGLCCRWPSAEHDRSVSLRLQADVVALAL